MQMKPIHLTISDLDAFLDSVRLHEEDPQAHVTEERLRAYIHQSDAPETERAADDLLAQEDEMIEMHLLECDDCREAFNRIMAEEAPWHGEAGAIDELTAVTFARIEGTAALSALLEQTERPAWVRSKIVEYLAEESDFASLNALCRAAVKDPDEQVRQTTATAAKSLFARRLAEALAALQGSVKERLASWVDPLNRGAGPLEATLHTVLQGKRAGRVEFLPLMSHPDLSLSLPPTRGIESSFVVTSTAVVEKQGGYTAYITGEYGSIVVDFLNWTDVTPPLVVLFPEDTTLLPRMPNEDELKPLGSGWQVVFQDLPVGAYLIVIGTKDE